MELKDGKFVGFVSSLATVFINAVISRSCCFLQLRFGRKIAGKLGKYAYYKVHDSEGDVWQLINCHFEISVVFVAELTTGTTKWSASCC